MRATHVLAACACCVATAHARPTITVDTSVPFSAKEISDAVEIRVHDSDARIHIARAGDVIVITVGDRARALQVDDAPPHDLARVVALVIVSLAEPSISTTPLPSPAAPPLPPAFDREAPPEMPSIHSTRATPPPSPYALRATIGHQRTDGGVYTTPVLASLAAAITPQVRVVVSAGVDEHGTKNDTATSALGRIGVEGRFGALGLELGGAGFAFHACNDDIGGAGGVYGTARIYLPVSPRAQLVLEAGGYYVKTDFMSCETSGSYTPATRVWEMQGPYVEIQDEYAGHVGIGVEWAL